MWFHFQGAQNVALNHERAGLAPVCGYMLSRAIFCDERSHRLDSILLSEKTIVVPGRRHHKALNVENAFISERNRTFRTLDEARFNSDVFDRYCEVCASWQAEAALADIHLLSRMLHE
jgi:hypothetical protein